MNEENLWNAHQIGQVIKIIQTTTNHLFDPDELMTVIQILLHSVIHLSLSIVSFKKKVLRV